VRCISWNRETHLPKPFLTKDLAMPDAAAAPNLWDTLREKLGVEHVIQDETVRTLMSQDIYAKAALVGAVVRPGTTADVSAAVKAAGAFGIPVLPRGGGMSYTGGYISDHPGALLMDLTRLNRVLEVNVSDMYVRVEAGATWADLDAALAPHGLRTPFWGPLSGLASTIGGGLSQNNAFFGAGQYGPTADSVTSVTVVLANGDVVHTGSAGAPAAAPFFRHYGPDVTGLFLGDCGAFGVKTEAALRLIHRPAHEAYLSFSFNSKEPCALAMSAVAREGLACEVFGFDPELARLRLKRASLLADAGTLMKVVGAQKSLLEGLREGAKMAVAGRGFMEAGDYSIHAVVEGRSKASVEADASRIRDIIAAQGGKEVENTIPKVIRAQPFTPLNNVLGPSGERWAPVHGIVSHSKAIPCWQAIEALFARFQETSTAVGLTTGYLVTTLSTNAFLIEPVFYWPEARAPLHEATIEPAFLAKLPRLADNQAATAHVAMLRAAIVELFTSFGATHFQVGRAYPLHQTRTPEAARLLAHLKNALDPKHLMNPGVLGLRGAGA
jgi:D-lactate dehydrogenase (cytochrome)